MDRMRENATSISFQAASEMGVVRSVKNAWKKEVSQYCFSRDTLARALRGWRRGKHELLVDKGIVLKE